jgi:hypothetical protein
MSQDRNIDKRLQKILPSALVSVFLIAYAQPLFSQLTYADALKQIIVANLVLSIGFAVAGLVWLGKLTLLDA